MDEQQRHAYARCPECNGTGGWIPIHSGPEECDNCHGTGLIKVPHPDGPLFTIGRTDGKA